MKRKRIDLPWTPFLPAVLPDDHPSGVLLDDTVFLNSRYQVNCLEVDAPEPFGAMLHLSIKRRDKRPIHDWRDLQRIKNELCGTERQAVEIYPPESLLVDSANQYHLWVFDTFRLPFGFHGRLVSERSWHGSRQRAWAEGERPPDCITNDDMERLVDAFKTRKNPAQGSN